MAKNRASVETAGLENLPGTASGGVESFVARAHRLSKNGHTTAALDLIYDCTDEMMSKGRFSQLDSVLSDIAICDLSVDLLLGVLTATLPGRHIGILHQDEGSDAFLMLHLAWHHRLRKEAPPVGFLWVDPAIHPRRLVQVAAICRKIWKANSAGGIPYAFSPPNDCFDVDSGKYLFGPTRLGLTCATFILALFHVAGLQLVKYM